MNYQEFLTDIHTQLSLRMEENVSLQIQKIAKNNGMSYDGLIIMRPDLNISPTIYLTPYYQRYLEGVSMEDIYLDILETYHRHLPNENFDTSIFTDYEKAKKRLVMRLVHFDRNRELLSEIPHYRYLDFAVIFYCLLQADEKNQASILIYRHHLDLWGIDKDTLYRTALANTPVLLPYQLESMSSILQNMLHEDSEEMTSQKFPIYVLSNQYHTNGAGTILYDGLLQRIADDFQQDLIVLPSSIHEVLLIPVNEILDYTQFSDMVKEVNETQLTDDEILSDHVYLFSREDRILSIKG